MDKSVVKHRRKLNDQQIEVLELLYRFRFGSNSLFAEYFGKKDRSFVFKRLKILLEQGYIGKRFDSSYRIQGKPAAYYLLPAGARVLQGLRTPEKAKEIKVKAIYNDKNVKDGFVAHCLSVFVIHNWLKALYGDKQKLFSKSGLAVYGYFPRPLPDAYISLKTGAEGKDKPKRYLLDIFEDDIPFFILIRRIKKYIYFSKNNDWPKKDSLPAILMLTESPRRQKQLARRIAKELREAELDEDNILFATSTLEAVTKAKTNQDKIWQLADQDKTMEALENIFMT